MILSTMVKLKTLGLAQQVVTGAFINGALIGGALVAAALAANQSRSGTGMLCQKPKSTAPQDP
ncbi:MAG: hypothetical protein AAF601_08350 [Pseudomonadota bacterium]